MGEANPARVAWQKELQRDLDRVLAVGDFAVQRTHNQFINPGLEINGRLLSLPLSPVVADRIKAVANPASFSRNEANVVGQSPNLIWELDHDQFRIVNPAWPAFLESIKQYVAHGLNFALSDIDFEPDKLLLYEKGSSVRRHKAPQETPEVTGRLVICLPSGHAGGEVCVENAGRHHTFATAPTSAFDLSVLAWYSSGTEEVMEVTSGRRLELTYSMKPRATVNSAYSLMNQHMRLKERIDRWPKDVTKSAYVLDHKYSPESLSSSKLKGRDLALVEVLKSVCSEAGIYLFLGNIVMAKDDPYDDEHFDKREDAVQINLDCLYTTEGIKIASHITLSEPHLFPADEVVERDWEEKSPELLVHHGSAIIILIPRKWLYCLLRDNTNEEVLVGLVIDEQKHHPSNVNVRVDILKLINKILDGNCQSLEIVESAWNLKDMPLYHRAIRCCAKDDWIRDQLPKRLATLVAESPAPQVVNWSQGLGDLLDCFGDIGRILAVLNEFEQALDKRYLQDSFQVWVAKLKRDKLTSSQYLAKADLDSVQALANSLWHDKDWVDQRFTPELGCCQNRTLITKVIETLVAKDSDNALPGAKEVARKILNGQLQRLCLGTVNLLSVHDQQASNEVYRFINTIRLCLTSGFTKEALKLIERIKPDMDQQLHYSESLPSLCDTRTVSYAPNLAHRLMCMLGGLQDAYEPQFMDSLRDLFEYLLRKYVLDALSPGTGRDRSRALKDLREKRFRKILGRYLYRELILLETPPMNHDHSSQTVAGVKRVAEEELVPPPRSGESWWIT